MLENRLILGLFVLVILAGLWHLYTRSQEVRDGSGNPQEVVESTPEVTESTDETPEVTPPVVSSDSAAALKALEAKLIGKWRNAASQNQIYTLGTDYGFEESYLTGSGQFMVPRGTWRLEKIGTTETIDPSKPNREVVLVRVSEKGAERRFEVQAITATEVELFEIDARDTVITWLRIEN